jgi:hypothetical protein
MRERRGFTPGGANFEIFEKNQGGYNSSDLMVALLFSKFKTSKSKISKPSSSLP